MTCLSVAVTLGADSVAMLRYPSVWIGFPAGLLLAALVGGMALLTALVVWRIHHAASICTVPSAQQRWARAMGISLVSVIILAWYPLRIPKQALNGDSVGSTICRAVRDIASANGDGNSNGNEPDLLGHECAVNSLL